MRLRRVVQASFVLLAVMGSSENFAFSKPQRVGPVSASPAASSRDRRAGFGAEESIFGTIAAVDQRGLLILKREGPSEPATTQLTVAESRDDTSGRSHSSVVQAAPGPGRTDYSFRVTASTKIRVNGRTESLADLAGLQNRQATVRFIPRRSGNFAASIEVSE